MWGMMKLRVWFGQLDTIFPPSLEAKIHQRQARNARTILVYVSFPANLKTLGKFAN
jgi:hypothetical protein